jgi:hypothetical protein
MPDIQAQISDEDYAKLIELAEKRGVDANTVLQQAISTEKLISDNVKPGDDLIIKKSDNSFAKVNFSK